ncbi:MAG: YciI family protein [Pseudomonadota bacterium]
MQYMLVFNETEAQFVARQNADATAYWSAWRAYMDEMGSLIERANALEGPETATVIRTRDGRLQVQDGPAPEAKEMLGGYVIIEVPDLDAALKWAAKAPCAATGSVEVRPVMQMG